MWVFVWKATERKTRQAAYPKNIKPQTARLDIRRNFCSNKVVSDWNKIYPDINGEKSAHGLMRNYAKYRDRWSNPWREKC
jgi:hypothetical protein